MQRLALFAALLSWPAHAYCPPAEPPPARFDQPYDGKLVEWALPLAEIPAACARLSGRYDPRSAGCGYEVHVTHDGTRSGRPIETYGHIVYPKGCAAIRRHEIAHTNGWAHGFGHARND
jgi:hypothetical protein